MLNTLRPFVEKSNSFFLFVKMNLQTGDLFLFLNLLSVVNAE